jgi:hypothetical protein
MRMATRAEVASELTAWLCAWLDVDPGATRLMVKHFVTSGAHIDERDFAPVAGKIDAYARNALRNLEERLDDLGLRFAAGDSIHVRTQQIQENPNLGAVLLNELRALVVDFHNFWPTPGFNAKQTIANTVRLIRALSR